MARLGAAFVALVACSAASIAAPPPPKDRAMSPEELFAEAKPSVVVIAAGEKGGRDALGTGFIARPGLVATNLHVIGEGRAISVREAAGRFVEVRAIHAFDRALDLAILEIDAPKLPALPLGDESPLPIGAPLVAIGNPLGLEHSVVAGLLSARRVMDGRTMLQVAMPVEPGNSGGPLLDARGRVRGIVTAKSRMTDNLAFAIAIEYLRPLLDRPNRVGMERWQRWGRLDPEEWVPQFGAQWRRRASHIEVDGLGSGFGGRSICLWQKALPRGAVEVAVRVKLDDEAGAAGLVFAADGGERHWGFYPTGGRLRLTRFDGPDVRSWTIVRDFASSHYRAGDWNHLRVRLEADRIRCWVNGASVLEHSLSAPPEGQVGLAKFRDTKAWFRDFEVGADLSGPAPVALSFQADALLALKPEVERDKILRLARQGPRAADSLRTVAQDWDRRAEHLRRLADRVHEAQVSARLAAFRAAGEGMDLMEASLEIARLDVPDLDVAAYVREVDRMARELRRRLKGTEDEIARRRILDRYLFEEEGFHGCRVDYHARRNSYINQVIDDREGLPITLSVLYIELARRLELKVVGIALPGHFIVRHVPRDGQPVSIDVFAGGTEVTRDESRRRVMESTGRPPTAEEEAPAKKLSILIRMLHNLLGAAQREGDAASAIRYGSAIVALDPDDASVRWMLAVLLHQAGRDREAITEADWLIEHAPAAERERLTEFRQLLGR